MNMVTITSTHVIQTIIPMTLPLRRNTIRLGFRNPLVASRLICSSSSASNSSARATTRKLVLYSKPGCCLCDGLKEKLSAAFRVSGGADGALLDDVVHLETRDITTNPEWERAYQYEIPVLAKVHLDGREEVLPRLSPRIGIEQLHKKIADALGL